MPDKARKHTEVVQIYLDHDFLEAYALHTDLRVAENPHGAIGNDAEWEYYGDLQLQFLIQMGLQPHHRLLDVGCGTGRLARKAVRYLNESRYVGLDLSGDALNYAIELSRSEGWASNRPVFAYRSHGPIGKFDFIWAFSVYIHVPTEILEEDFVAMASRMHADSQFLFSFVAEQAEARTGLKQYRHTTATYKDACRNAGLTFESMTWPGKQLIGLAALR